MEEFTQQPDRVETALIVTAEQMEKVARRAELMAKASRVAARSATGMAAAGRRARSARSKSPSWLPWALLGGGVFLILAMGLLRKRKKRRAAGDDAVADAPGNLEPEDAAADSGAAAG